MWLGALVFQSLLHAQNEIPISLEDAKLMARDKNPGLLISKQDYAIAKAHHESSRAVLLPSLKVTNTSTFTNNPLNAFGFKLLQREVSAPDFNPDVLNDPGDDGGCSLTDLLGTRLTAAGEPQADQTQAKHKHRAHSSLLWRLWRSAEQPGCQIASHRS